MTISESKREVRDVAQEIKDTTPIAKAAAIKTVGSKDSQRDEL